jgi:fimbrial isopeptide formation D2 family protein/LPXTG-motif cell wall-anchored protein
MAIITTFMMAFTMGSTAFAADNNTHSISLNPNDTHTYRVFQVLTGTLAKEGETALGNPAWGADVVANPGDVNYFIAQITATDPKPSEQQIADLVASKVDTTKQGQGTVDKDHSITNLATGYYVMIDETDLKEYGTDTKKIDTQALHVVQVVNDIENMTIKWGTTEDTKIIVSDTLGDINNHVINGNADNVSIGDTVNFQITAVIPSNADLYNYFYFIINDKLDNGLTLDSDNISVSYKESKSATESNPMTKVTDYILKTGNDADPYSFQIGLTNAKSLKGKVIVVTYSAVLNDKATIGETANKNESTVTYSNNPNHVYNGENKNPGFPAEGDTSAMGETPKTETETYTTGIEIQKVDESGKVLTGAEFELSGVGVKTVLTREETFNPDDNGTYYKLKNGTYTKEAPTLDDYMKQSDGATSGYVEDADYTDDDKVVINNKTYRPYVPSEDAGKVVYILMHGNGDLYESTSQKYTKTITKTTANETTNNKIKMTVDSNGLVRFDGLGEGTYTIKETTTPAGYNTMNDMTVTVGFNADNTPKWSVTSGSGTYDQTEGIIKVTIENNKGTELPSTGGIGTTIFYIVGGVMVAGAVVFLLTKRRIAGNE